MIMPVRRILCSETEGIALLTELRQQCPGLGFYSEGGADPNSPPTGNEPLETLAGQYLYVIPSVMRKHVTWRPISPEYAREDRKIFFQMPSLFGCIRHSSSAGSLRRMRFQLDRGYSEHEQAVAEVWNELEQILKRCLRECGW